MSEPITNGEVLAMMARYKAERDQARARVTELEAHNKRMWDFICSLDGMNAGHMHDGAIDDEIAIVASDFNALAAAEHSQKPEPDRQD